MIKRRGRACALLLVFLFKKAMCLSVLMNHCIISINPNANIQCHVICFFSFQCYSKNYFDNSYGYIFLTSCQLIRWKRGSILCPPIQKLQKLFYEFYNLCILQLIWMAILCWLRNPYCCPINCLGLSLIRKSIIVDNPSLIFCFVIWNYLFSIPLL